MINRNLSSEWLVSDEFKNQRIDYFLKKKIPNLSFPMICTLLRKGIIKINKKKVKNNYTLQEGDIIFSKINLTQNNILKKHNPKKSKDYLKKLIIYQNNDYYIINKPAGLAVQGGTKVNFNLDLILDDIQSKREFRPRLVHRLDRETSGILIISKNIQSANFFGSLFKERKIEKKYFAIVHGKLKKNQDQINNPIITKNKVYESLTKYKVLAIQNDKSFVIIKPFTGRKHQIRKHFFEIGNPIIGDSKYFLKNKKNDTIKNLFLHSYSVRFTDSEGKLRYFKADFPAYFKDIIELFGFKNFGRIENII